MFEARIAPSRMRGVGAGEDLGLQVEALGRRLHHEVEVAERVVAAGRRDAREDGVTTRRVNLPLVDELGELTADDVLALLGGRLVHIEQRHRQLRLRRDLRDPASHLTGADDTDALDFRHHAPPQPARLSARPACSLEGETVPSAASRPPRGSRAAGHAAPRARGRAPGQRSISAHRADQGEPAAGESSSAGLHGAPRVRDHAHHDSGTAGMVARDGIARGLWNELDRPGRRRGRHAGCGDGRRPPRRRPPRRRRAAARARPLLPRQRRLP